MDKLNKQTFLQKNKLALFGIAIVFFLTLTILSLGGEENGTTGFFLFGDPTTLTKCEDDLNACEKTTEVRDAQLAAANKTISNNTNTIKDLTNKKEALDTNLSTCFNEKQKLTNDYNLTKTQLLGCNQNLLDLNTDLNTCNKNHETCDTNLNSTINKWQTTQENYEACNTQKTKIQNEKTSLQQHINKLYTDNNTYFNLYAECNTSLTNCLQTKQEDQNNFNYLIQQTGTQITDANIYDISDTNNRLNAIKTLLCYFDNSHC